MSYQADRTLLSISVISIPNYVTQQTDQYTAPQINLKQIYNAIMVWLHAETNIIHWPNYQAHTFSEIIINMWRDVPRLYQILISSIAKHVKYADISNIHE